MLARHAPSAPHCHKRAGMAIDDVVLRVNAAVVVAVVVVAVHVVEDAVNTVVVGVLVVVYMCREEVERSASPYPQNCRY